MSPGNAMTITPTPKTGFGTSEFWVTVVTLSLPVLTLVFRKDLSDYVEVIAAVAAAITTAAYTISRALTKSAQVRASAAAGD